MFNEMLDRRQAITAAAAIIPTQIQAHEPQLTLTEVILTADKPNHNNRVYPKSLLIKIHREIQPLVREHCVFGRIGFPEDGQLSFSDISHKVTSLELQNNELVATITPLNTPNGKILQEMIRNGTQLSLRTAGIGDGETQDDGTTLINDNYKLVAICVVPSEDAA